MAAITHILFDLGNTLIYFDGDWPSVFRHALSAAGRAAVAAGAPVDAHSFSVALKGRLEAYYKQRESDFIESSALSVLVRTLESAGAGGQSGAVLEAILGGFYHVTQASWRTVRSAHDVLQALKAGGYRMAILSNAAHDDDVQSLVDQSALRPYMDVVLIPAASGWRKPPPGAFRSALSAWDAAAAEVLMVGDTLDADIVGARNSGMSSAWVRRYAVSRPGEKEAGRITADFELGRLDELPALLRSMAA